MIEIGSNVRVTIGTKQVYGHVTRVYNRGVANAQYSPNTTPSIYWDIEYIIDNQAPNRIGPGRWKQNVDGGYLQLA